MGVLPLDTLIPLVRLAVYEAMTVEGHDAVGAGYVADVLDANVTASYVKLAFRQLKALNEFDAETQKHALTGDTPTGNVFITAKGIRAVEKDLQDRQSLTSVYQRSGLDGSSIAFVDLAFAPASDRLVSFSDNEQSAKQARQSIDDLQRKIEQTNDLPERLAPFRQVALDEVDLLNVLINKTVVRAAMVIALARRLLPWIADKASGGAISELAKRALSNIIAWLS
jgi:hypothetical protein